nr:S24 family peptidase [uncultured Blautia sp.]
MKKENTSIRLKQLMEEKKLRQVDILEKAKPFCEMYGVKIGRNDLSQYVSGKVEPGQKKLTVLGRALDVNEVWLMGYDVPMERNDNIHSASHLYNKLAQQEIDLSGKKADWKISGTLDEETFNFVKQYMELDYIGKCNIKNTLKHELDRIKSLDEAKKQIEQLKNKLEKRCKQRVLYTYMQKIASAGTGFYFDDIPSDTIEAPYCKGADFVIGVNGDSMEPDYHDGDKLYVQKVTSLSIADVGIFTVWGECFVKELGEHGLISKNPAYDDIAETDDVRLIGRVLGKVEENEL